ncbi:hypothetical protein [Botrimarina hoheduenensis]|uniref:Gylcosyl hydrolase 115 C-terminal domain-containing protein n=1 Tax=Botrimarina hoheduenensis TaxID=2528000 RepID=A0A5C5VXF3_9BACT|nr:hypothetical protein [Botrimarina hoheduenensis]TWT43110.1 hypothetical protein Pla111_20600 [Botrimarina hoheduenensis]
MRYWLACLALLFVAGRVSAVDIFVEAECFTAQSNSDHRQWCVISADSTASEGNDGDPPHLDGASGKAYVELLPDTRRTHADKLTKGVNFSDEPGVVAVIDYEVDFPEAGRYYVWGRAYSTGSEDNGIHVGLNGEWPATGQRMQWCEGKNRWWWESKQRTPKEHCGVPHAIYLDIPSSGRHTVSFSMREDGFEFDQFLLTTDRDRPRPAGEAE